MNSLIIEISVLSVSIHIVFRLLIAFLFFRYFLPLLIKETLVKNGLRKLRYQLLLRDSLVFLLAMNGLIIIVGRYAGLNVGALTEVASYVATAAFVLYFAIGLIIYTQNYSSESKLMHEKIDEFERTEQQKLDKEKEKSVD